MAAVVFGAYWVQKKRREAFAQWAAGRGFGFFPGKGLWGGPGEMPSSFPALSEAFEIFRRGQNRSARNVCVGAHGRGEAAVYDYSYVTGGGKSRSTHSQTLFHFRSNGMCLPYFSLRPQNIFHSIGKAFGLQDIDFSDSPEFSKAFLLQGPDEAVLRERFNPSLRFHLSSRSDYCFEGLGDELIIWRSGRPAPTAELEFRFNEAAALLELFR
jgi:hypothetical protein